MRSHEDDGGRAESRLAGSSPSEMRAVFVGGNQKSGTSLLAALLARHSRITGLTGTGFPHDEGQFVQDVYVDELKMADSRLKTARWGYHPRAYLTEADVTTMTEPRARLYASWEPYWENPGAEIFVEKTPSNVAKIRFLRHVFPGSRIIIITRHPATQALAVRKAADRRALIGLDLEDSIAHWLFVMERLRDDLAHVGDIHICKYEDLISAPYGTLAAAQQYIGVDLEKIHHEGEIREDPRYMSYWKYLISQRGTERFAPLNRRKSLRSSAPRVLERVIAPTIGKRDAHKVISKFEDRVRRFGYSLQNPEKLEEWG